MIRTLLVSQALRTGNSSESVPAEVLSRAKNFVAILIAILDHQGATNFLQQPTDAKKKLTKSSSKMQTLITSIEDEANIEFSNEPSDSDIDRYFLFQLLIMSLLHLQFLAVKVSVVRALYNS